FLPGNGVNVCVARFALDALLAVLVCLKCLFGTRYTHRHEPLVIIEGKRWRTRCAAPNRPTSNTRRSAYPTAPNPLHHIPLQPPEILLVLKLRLLPLRLLLPQLVFPRLLHPCR